MNKKTIIIIVSIVLLSALSVVTFINKLSFQAVTFERSAEVGAIHLYSQKDSKTPYRTIEAGKNTTRLKTGTYYYLATGDNLLPKREEFTVGDGDITVRVNPDYTESYLKQLLSSEQTAINTAIVAKYSQIIAKYEVVSGRLFKKGEWYGAIVKERIDPREITDLYRIVLHKTDGNWVIVNRPEIIATTKLFPTVPVEILKAINALDEWSSQ